MPGLAAADPTRDPEPPRYLQLLWGLQTPTRRGPKPAFDIRDIGAAGVRVADAHGAAAVSMKAVGAELGVTTMALYRYVDSKEELMDVVLDEAYGPCPLRWSSRTGWRRRAETWARAIADVLVTRPWIVDVGIHRPPVTPNVLSWTEQGVAAFTATGLPAQATLSSLLVLDGFVRGHVRQSVQLGVLGRDGIRAPDDGGYERAILTLADPERFPALSAAVRDIEPGPAFYDAELDYGISVLLDGIAARVSRL